MEERHRERDTRERERGRGGEREKRTRGKIVSSELERESFERNRIAHFSV